MCCRLLDQKPFCLGAWRQCLNVFYYSVCLLPLWVICFFFLFSTWKLLVSFFIDVLKVLADISKWGLFAHYFTWGSLRFLNLHFFLQPRRMSHCLFGKFFVPFSLSCLFGSHWLTIGSLYLISFHSWLPFLFYSTLWTLS